MGVQPLYLREEHVKRSDDLQHDRSFEIRASCRNFKAVLLCTPLQDDGLECLFHGKGNDGRDEGNEYLAPLRPPPCLVLCDESSYNRPTLISFVGDDRLIGSTHPSTGPVKGAAMNMLDDTARLCGMNKSAYVPAPTANAGLPARPAKRRHMTRLGNVLEKPAPSVKSIKTGEETRYTIWRPLPSLSGALRIGPKARPSVYVVMPRSATVRETSKSRMTSATAGEKTEVPNVLDRFLAV